MKKKKTFGKLKIFAIISMGILLIIIAVFYSRYRQEHTFVYNKNLDKTAVTINDTCVTLEDMSYYVAIVEQQIQEMAISYNPDKPDELWNTHFSAGPDSVFTRDYAKSLAMELCIYDYIMSAEAEKKGFSINEEHREKCADYTDKMYSNLSKQAKDNIGITKDNLPAMVERHELVTAYVSTVAESFKEHDENVDASVLNYDGEFYKTVIYPEYKVTVNDAVWDDVKLGNLTVNL
ncbi:MAG: hypothetical protein ACI4E1_10635 [Lachnospira sp.]